MDFLLFDHRDKAVATRFFWETIAANGKPVKVTIDKIGTNPSAMKASKKSRSRCDKKSI